MKLGHKVYLLGFFRVSQYLRNLGKYEAFLICVNHFLLFLKVSNIK